VREIAATLALIVVAGCGDPVHDRAVEDLGGEKAGVPKGPLHRPGQPCLTCHGGEGPASFEMAFGGTVYARKDDDAPGAHADVRLLDAKNNTYDMKANCVGNFWVPRGAFLGEFPITAVATMTDSSSMTTVSNVMTTEMHRNGSCADCHLKPASPSSPGHLWALLAGSDAPPAACSGDESTRGVAGVLAVCPDSTTECAAPFPTYTNDVAPILAGKCTGCHQAKGENPSPILTSYIDISNNAKSRCRSKVSCPPSKTETTMTSLVTQCRMPPPPLDPLNAADRATFLCWAQGGYKE